MQFSSLFDLVSDAKDILDLFDDVHNTDQMTSRLDKLKRESPADFLACIVSLQASVDAAMHDTIDMSAATRDDDDIDADIDAEIKKLEELNAAEDQISVEPDAASEQKNDGPPRE